MPKITPKVFGHFRLVEDKTELVKILEVLSSLLPRSRRIYDAIKISMLGLESASPIYVPIDELGESFSGIVLTFAAEYKDPTSALSFTSKEEDAKRACRLVEESVDWKKDLVFGAISEWHLPHLLKISAKNALIHHCVDCPLFEYCEKDETSRDVLTTDNSSSDVTVKPLDPKFSKLVNDAWKFRNESSLEWIEDQCRLGLGFGVFVPNEEEPVSWVMTYRYGSMGLLHTKPDYRGRGYAKLCVQTLCKHLTALGICPNVYIENDNSVSFAMFEKLGFRNMFPAAWMLATPKEKFESEA